jgi:hypothetical protein
VNKSNKSHRDVHFVALPLTQQREQQDTLTERDHLSRDRRSDHDEHTRREADEVARGAPPVDRESDVRQTEEDDDRNHECIHHARAQHCTGTEITVRVEDGPQVHDEVREASSDGEERRFAFVDLQTECQSEMAREWIDVVHPEHAPPENHVRQQHHVQDDTTLV